LLPRLMTTRDDAATAVEKTPSGWLPPVYYYAMPLMPCADEPYEPHILAAPPLRFFLDMMLIDAY